MFDVLVIGAGPGGYTAAIRAAQLGAKTGLVESREVGGVCLHRGCIPTKALLESAEAWESLTGMGERGITVTGAAFDPARAWERKDRIVRQLTGGVEGLLKSYGVDLLRGRAKFGPGTPESPLGVEVIGTEGPRSAAGKALIIATGSRPGAFSVPGAEGAITSDEALALKRIPQRLAVIGGGVIGVEMASLFASFGARVTILEMQGTILPGVDEEIALLMGKILMARGIGIRTGAAVRRIEEAGEGRRVLWEEAGKGECLEAEAVLAAVGRVPNTEGLAEVGLRVEGGRILTDERQRTSLPGVYAVGDAAGGRLAHGAMAEGRAAAQRAVQTAPADCFAETRADEGSIPFCVYTRPEIAGVGITLGEARKQGVDPLVGKFPLAGNARALTLGEPRGFVKVLADRRDHRILGVHLFGPGVTELAGEAALALRLGAALEDLRGVIHPHPTVSEALGEAAWDATGECGYKFARRPVC